MKIITKLIMSYIVIIPLIVLLGFSTITFSESILEKEIGEYSHHAISQILENIDKLIFFHVIQSYTISSDQFLQETLMSSNQEFVNMDSIDSFIDQTDKEWISVPKNEISPFMYDMINSDASNFLKGISDFYEHEFGYPVYAEIFVTNAYGANVAQTGKTSDFRQDDEEWWRHAKQNGLFFNDIQYDDSSGVYSVDIAIRIDDKDGNFLGIMKNSVNIQDLIEVINNAKKESKFQTEYEWITNNKKTVYSTEDSRMIHGNMFLDTYTTKVFEGSENYLLAFGDEISEEHDHSEYLYAWAQSDGYRNFPGFDWIIISESKTDEMFSPISDLKFFLLVISGIVFTVIAILGIIISRSIVLPINMLRKITKDITEGKFDTNVLIKGDDDIQRLSNDVNIMSRKIKEQFEKLELHDVQKNEFLAMITHELKTPLVPIQGYADILLSGNFGPLTDKQKERISIIKSSATSLFNIISDLLDVQKLEFGQLRIKKDISSIKSTVEKAVASMQPEADKRKVKIILSCPDIVMLHDSARTIQILTNLLKNSLNSMTEKDGVVQITVKDHLSKIIISVNDNGIGIPTHKQKDLFKKFYQVDSSFTRDGGGSGLGLSICKGLVAILGGNMGFESYTGKGSVFYFSLPK